MEKNQQDTAQNCCGKSLCTNYRLKYVKENICVFCKQKQINLFVIKLNVENWYCINFVKVINFNK